MKFVYVGRNVKVTEGMKAAAEEKLSYLAEYFNKGVDVNIVMSVNKAYQVVEVTMYSGDFIIRAEENSDDIYTALGNVAYKLERLIIKHKSRLQKKYHETIRYSICENDDYSDETDGIGAIVKRKSVDLKPMTEEEAILQMELLNHDFFVFMNQFGKTSVIYKRKNSDYGLIENS